MTDVEYIPKEEVYPMWERAVLAVVDRFGTESYGLTITHVELKELMGIEPAETVESVQKEQLDYLSGIEKVKNTLLEDYNLCFFNSIGNGYRILHPEEQIRKGADYYIKKSQKSLTKSMKTLANVDAEHLDVESIQLQHLKIGRIAFIKSSFRKRIPQPENPKKIENNNNEPEPEPEPYKPTLGPGDDYPPIGEPPPL